LSTQVWPEKVGSCDDPPPTNLDQQHLGGAVDQGWPRQRARPWWRCIASRICEVSLLETFQRIVGGYIRGQVALALLIGALVGLGMLALRVPYAILLGVLAFVLEFIPILGTLISGAICVLVALTQGFLLAAIVLLYFVVVHVIEGDVVGPRIVGKAVGLHPVLSIVALVAGAEVFGIWGALLASPVAGVAQAVAVDLWIEWRKGHAAEFGDVADAASREAGISYSRPACGSN